MGVNSIAIQIGIQKNESTLICLWYSFIQLLRCCMHLSFHALSKQIKLCFKSMCLNFKTTICILHGTNEEMYVYSQTSIIYNSWQCQVLVHILNNILFLRHVLFCIFLVSFSSLNLRFCLLSWLMPSLIH